MPLYLEFKNENNTGNVGFSSWGLEMTVVKIQSVRFNTVLK